MPDRQSHPIDGNSATHSSAGPSTPSAGHSIPSPPPSVAVVLAACVRRALLIGWSYRTAQILRLAGFAFALVSLVFMARLVDAAAHPDLALQGGYAAFALIGLAAADLQRAGASALAQRLREAQLQGTLEALLATPAPTWLVLLGTVLPDVLASLARAAAIVAVGALLMDVIPPQADLGAALAVALLAMLAFAALGLVGAALTLALRRSDPFGAVVGSLSIVAGGVLYPRSVLPAWLQTAGDFLPVTPALDALRRSLLLGDGLHTLAPELLRLALFTLALAPIGGVLFVVTLRRARTDGSLSFY